MAAPATNTKDPWLPFREARTEAPVVLVCLPFAGGGAGTYRPWQAALGDAAEVWAVQLPGRETRLFETPLADRDELVETLDGVLTERLDDRPVVLFGHSMGGLLAYELALRWEARGAPRLVHLLPSAARAPHSELPGRPLYDLPTEVLLAELASMGGSPKEVLADRGLMELFLPAIRADLTLSDTYRRRDAPTLAAPITNLAGADDTEVNRDKLLAWQELAGGAYAQVDIPGGHFYVNTARDQVLDVVRGALAG